MSDNFDRKVYELSWIAVSCQLFNLSTQLDNTNLGHPITKQYLILFSLWCKKVALAFKEKPLKQNMVRSKCLNNFWSPIFINFTGSPLYEEFWSIIYHSLLYFAILIYINEL